MRLDHLLSKEQLAASVVQSPDQNECFCWVLMGGTLDKASFGEIRAEYAASAVGKGRVCRAGACTLLGPEGPDVIIRTSGPFLVSLLGDGRGSARTLRTTQWTRASLS